MKGILVYTVITLFIVGLFLGLTKWPKNPMNVGSELQYEVFEVKNGYGYQIGVKDKILIRQEYIPILQGKKPFSRAEDAERTANKIMSKLLKKESPMLTTSELIELQIPEFNSK